MERRNFLKGLFGVAIVTAIPKPVFEKMVETPLPEPTKDVIEYVKEQIGPYKHLKPIAPNGLLYLYDEKDNLLAVSMDFNLIKKRPVVSSIFIEDMAYHQFVQGPSEWKVEVSRLQLLEKNFEDWFWSDTPVKMVLIDREYKILGNSFITQSQVSTGLEELPIYYCELSGAGALILESIKDE